jgi:hypothetical protein
MLDNDFEKWGIGVHEAANGEWKVAKIHHLTPDENKGRHNIYIDALDESGQRVTGAMLWWGDSGGVMERVSMDKPAGEPMCNIPIFRGQVIYVSMGEKSPTVVGLHSMHGDELGPNGEIWNSNGHHSFYIVFQKVGSVDTKKTCPCCGRELA